MGIESALGLGASVLGSVLSKKGSSPAGSTTSTQQQQMDPQIRALLLGQNGGQGLLQQLAAQGTQGQSAGQTAFGSGMDSYLGNWGTDSFMRSQQAAQQLQGTHYAAPQAQDAGGATNINIDTTQVDAPAQNGLNLRSAFDRMINGDAGASPYLTSAIQGGIDQSKLAFGQMQQDATRNLNENVLTGIKSNSIASGGYGGSRQGLAEGRAIGDFGRAQQNAINQFGQNNTNAAVGAQAQAFNQGQDRSLQAMMGLSGQQYGLASQNASLDQQAQMANQNGFQQAQLANANLRQGTSLANLQAQLATNSQNTQNQASGIGLSSGLLGQAFGMGQTNNNAALNRLTQTAGAMAPYSGAGGSSTNSQPYYTNQAGGMLGGAAAGLGLYNQIAGSSSGGTNWGSLGSLFGSNGSNSFWNP